jgi:hypothetical protein
MVSLASSKMGILRNSFMLVAGVNSSIALPHALIHDKNNRQPASQAPAAVEQHRN